mmetsp:Transcript_14544/g.33934  ORF Transcript_14544/g.33934 Transcript_14544/m.33934 type:complete len:263 (+) Transcript_14544:3739-4527(+)
MHSVNIGDGRGRIVDRVDEKEDLASELARVEITVAHNVFRGCQGQAVGIWSRLVSEPHRLVGHQRRRGTNRRGGADLVQVTSLGKLGDEADKCAGRVRAVENEVADIILFEVHVHVIGHRVIVVIKHADGEVLWTKTAPQKVRACGLVPDFRVGVPVGSGVIDGENVDRLWDIPRVGGEQQSLGGQIDHAGLVNHDSDGGRGHALERNGVREGHPTFFDIGESSEETAVGRAYLDVAELQLEACKVVVLDDHRDIGNVERVV